MAQTADVPQVTLVLLGGADLRGLDRASSDSLLGQAKVVALLTYVTLAGADRHWLRRDMLAALLWPELDQSHARAALRKGVLAIRNALGPDVLLSRGDEELKISEGALACDAVEFTRDIDAGRLQRALELYKGDLLPGFHLTGCVEFDRWLDVRRTETRERAGAAAWALAQMFDSDSAMTAAGQWAKKAVRYSWDDERTLRRALALLERAGERAGALRLYDEFARRLQAEFDAQPSEETIELVNRIKGRRSNASP
jgi:DNA-binding SARP family transcriptional activator